MEKVTLIKEFLEKNRNLEEKLIDYLNKEESNENDFLDLINIFNQLINKDKTHFRYVLNLISKIADYYKIYSFKSIEKILLNYKNDILQNFSNTEIFTIFHANKKILLILFDQKILIPDKLLFHMIQDQEYERKSYLKFFSIEFEPFLTEELKQKINYSEIISDIELFKQKRAEGENDSQICKIIRDDLVVEFISYQNQTNLSLLSQIPDSFYETHQYLLEKKVSLFEYAAFYGSIQIFKYLEMQGIKMDSSLWYYVIHGQNAELIHNLEENKIEPPNNDFFNCYKEAVKCHSANFTNYIKDNLLNSEIIQNRIKFVLCGLEYYNFTSFSDDFESAFQLIFENCNKKLQYEEDLFRLEIINCLVKNDYLVFVQFLLEIPELILIDLSHDFSIFFFLF